MMFCCGKGHEDVEGFGTLDFVLDHADGGRFGHAELRVYRYERKSVEEELPIFGEGSIGEEAWEELDGLKDGAGRKGGVAQGEI
jgi:hypothetical protein